MRALASVLGGQTRAPVAGVLACCVLAAAAPAFGTDPPSAAAAPAVPAARSGDQEAPSTASAPAASDAQEWSTEEPKAPTRTLEFVATEGTWMSVDVSPDGRTIVFDLLGHLYEMPVEGGEARALTQGRSWNMFPRYSPDGARIAFTSDRSGRDALWVYERATGGVTQVSKHDLPVSRAGWSADGRHLYASALDQAGKSRGLQFNLHGSHFELFQSDDPATQFADDAARSALYFEQSRQKVYEEGARIRKWDKRTGQITEMVERPGGAFNPTVSPDGRRLAYLHRDDREVVLVVRDLDTRSERVVYRGLDRDRQDDAFYHYGAHPSMAWHPSGKEIMVAAGGQIRAVEVESGKARAVLFRAPVRREINETVRFPVEIPETEARTRSHRWAHRAEPGILFEALGDLYLKAGGDLRNLTGSPEHDTSPVYDPRARTLYYASWSDDSLGAVYARPLERGRPRRLSERPGQYGSLALSPDGRTLAFLRGLGAQAGRLIEEETDFELVVLPAGGAERKVTDVAWLGTYEHLETKHPPGLAFDPSGTQIYFSEFADDALVLKRIRTDGTDEVALYRFPHAVRVVPSPDLKWLAFREYHRSYATPLEFVGKTVTVSAADKQGYAQRVDPLDGDFLGWSADSSTLHWTRGGVFLEKRLADVLAQAAEAEPKSEGDSHAKSEAGSQGRSGGGPQAEGEGDSAPGGEPGPLKTDLSFAFAVEVPRSTLALTGVRVVTMNPAREVLEETTVVVRGNRIAAVGRGIAVPPEAKVYDLRGHTVVPGLVDSHAHYGSPISLTNVVEQRVPGLLGPLAHGVTTMYEVYGTAQKDFWLSDMLRRGALAGPRLFSVGSPIYGLREFRPRLYRDIASIDDAREHVRYNKAFGATGLKDYVTFTRSARHQLVTAAREEGVQVYSETAATPQMNWTQVIDGVTGLEHTPGLTPLYGDVVRLLAASGVGITPTLLVVYNGPEGEARFHMSERLWESPKLTRFARREDLLRLRRRTHIWPDDLYAPEMAREMKKLRDAGVSIHMGGHGQMLGLDAHWEMELLVEGGFTPLQALEVATINGARYHGLDRQIGSVEAGKLADLVVLRDNPLEDIRHTRSVVYVILNGALYSGEDAGRVFPDPQPPGRMYFDR